MAKDTGRDPKICSFVEGELSGWKKETTGDCSDILEQVSEMEFTF